MFMRLTLSFRKHIWILTEASGDSTSLRSSLEETLECRTFMLKGTSEIRVKYLRLTEETEN